MYRIKAPVGTHGSPSFSPCSSPFSSIAGSSPNVTASLVPRVCCLRPLLLVVNNASVSSSLTLNKCLFIAHMCVEHCVNLPRVLNEGAMAAGLSNNRKLLWDDSRGRGSETSVLGARIQEWAELSALQGSRGQNIFPGIPWHLISSLHVQGQQQSPVPLSSLCHLQSPPLSSKDTSDCLQDPPRQPRLVSPSGDLPLFLCLTT